MTLDAIVSILVAVTLIELMFATGLGVTLTDVAAAIRDWRLVARASVANYVAVPAATIALLLLIDPDPMTAAGFLILAVCPGAPYGPPLTALAGGQTATSVGLMVLLACSSVALAPLLLPVLIPMTIGSGDLHVDPVAMLGAILGTQLLPLCAGLAVRHWRPNLAARWLHPAVILSKLLNGILLAVLLITQLPDLLRVRPVGIGGMIVLLAISLAAGWVSGRQQKEERRTLALATSIRNVGLGIEITAAAFPGTHAVTAVLAYGVVQLLGSFLVALWWHRNPALTPRAAA